MTEINKTIIDMIMRNATANEICSTLKITNKQLFRRLNDLRAQGYDFLKKYYYDGEICYDIAKDLEHPKDVALHTKQTDNEVTVVLISDVHFANKNDRMDLLKRVYEYCSKENIHIIINLGDMIDGFLGKKDDKRFIDPDEQIEYLLKHLPFDKSIINFICYGNHDYDFFEKTGRNVANILEIKRNDMVSLGYGAGVLKVKNDEIKTCHSGVEGTASLTNDGLILLGHKHKAEAVNNSFSTRIRVPSLSNVICNTIPGFIKAKIDFNTGVIAHGIFEYFIFLDDKMFKINEFNCQIHSTKKSKGNKVQYEESRPKFNFKSKEYSKLSQVEKFNQRYRKKY